MSTNKLDDNHPYKQIVEILEDAQKHIKEVLPAFVDQDDPKSFDSAHNTKVAQAIALMTKTLAEPGRNKKVGLWTMKGLLPILLDCIKALTENKDKALPIPNLNHQDADDTTFKLCAIYLTVLKGLNVDYCPSAKDYISVLSWAGKAWMDDLTIHSPEKLTNDLTAYFKKLDDSRQAELLTFVDKIGLDDLKIKLKYSLQPQVANEVAVQLDNIKKLTLKQMPINILARMIQKARNIKLNTRGHHLLAVNGEADFPEKFLTDKPTLVKYKTASGEDAVTVFQYEWPSAFSMQMSTEPTNVADIKFPEGDEQRYQVGIIRVKDTNTAYYVDVENKTLKKLEYSSEQLKRLDELIKSSGKCRSLNKEMLRGVESINPTVLSDMGRKLVQFNLDAGAESVKSLVFPKIGEKEDQLAYNEEKYKPLYRHIVKSYTIQISHHKPTSSLVISDQILAMEESIKANKESIAKLAADRSLLQQEIASLDEKITHDRNNLGSAVAQHISPVASGIVQFGLGAADTLANLPILKNLAAGVLPGAVNMAKEAYIAAAEPERNILHSLEEKLEAEKGSENELNNQIESLNRELVQNRKILFKLRLEQFNMQALKSFSEKCVKFTNQISSRLARLQESQAQNSFTNADALIQQTKQIKDELIHLRIKLTEDLSAFDTDLSAPDIFDRDLHNLCASARSSFDELAKTVDEAQIQEIKISEMENTASEYFSVLLQENARKLRHNFAYLSGILWNSQALPYLALLAGAIALTIALGILLSNPHFLAIFVIPAIIKITTPLAITGVALGGTVVLASVAKIAMNYRLFKSAPKDTGAGDVVNVAKVDATETTADNTSGRNLLSSCFGGGN